MQRTTRQEIATVERDDPEWHRIWDVIRDLFGDYECERDGEVWGYMGTTANRRTPRSYPKGAWHEFRHRIYQDRVPPSSKDVIISTLLTDHGSQRVYVAIRADAVWATSAGL